MDSIEERMSQKFAAFEQQQDPALLYEILDSLEAAESEMSAEDPAARNLALARRLHFFAMLDRNIDPLWDPNDVPVRGVPPPASHGVIYGSGEVDPATIPDPEVRKQYVQALQASKDAYQRYGVQLRLRRIDERAMSFVARFLTDRSPNRQRDNRQFEELLAASPLSATRRERLQALMSKPG